MTSFLRDFYTCDLLEKMKPNIEDKSWLTFPTLGWLLGSIWLFFTLPWLTYQILFSLRYEKLKKQLNGKVVLITGASSGLGEALAHSFYKAGCKIILASRRESELNRVKNMLLQMHPTSPAYTPVVLPMDLSDLGKMNASVEKILAIFGRVDILINNAGISHRGSALATNIDVDMKIMLVNYFGQIALTKAVLPHMIKQKSGHIVVISSVQGLIGIPHRSAYAASKHALQGFFDSLRAELVGSNVKVTVVSPGYVFTKLSLNALTGDGKPYGEMDPATAEGFTPESVSEAILKCVLQEKKELVISTLSPRIAIFLRKWIPSLYFWIMEKRARKFAIEAKFKNY